MNRSTLCLVLPLALLAGCASAPEAGGGGSSEVVTESKTAPLVREKAEERRRREPSERAEKDIRAVLP